VASFLQSFPPKSYMHSSFPHSCYIPRLSKEGNIINIVTCQVTVDGVLDCQLGLLDHSVHFTVYCSTFHCLPPQPSLFSDGPRTSCRPIYSPKTDLLTRNSLSKPPSSAKWPSVYSLALFSGQPFPSKAFFLSCLSSRY
jgi:hypothetical protein